MSDLLPLFPLPNVVLFPHVFLPLHIFEPRYRDMVGDALASDRLIGMVLLKEGWDDDHYDERPPIYPIGCTGLITHVEHLSDGRYDIVLRGVERFRVLEENYARTYRRGLVETLIEPVLGDEDRALVRWQRAKLESLLAPAVEHSGVDPRTTSAMTDEDLVNALAQYLDLEPLEKQALLERPCLRSRAEALVELLEIRDLTARTPEIGRAHV